MSKPTTVVQAEGTIKGVVVQTTGEQETETEVFVIRIIRLRRGGTSLEGSFLKALLKLPHAKREVELAIQGYLCLDTPVKIAEDVEWQFNSAAILTKPKAADDEEALYEHHLSLLGQGVLLFNVGDDHGPGAIDHHDDQSDDLSAIDLLRDEDHDFLNVVSYLRGVYLLVSENDVSAKRLAKGGDNIRSLMTALVCLYPGKDKKILDCLYQAFLGTFKQCEEGVHDEQALSVTSAIDGLRLRGDGEAADELAETWKQAQETKKLDWKQACAAVDQAKKENNIHRVLHPILCGQNGRSGNLRRPVYVAVVRSDAIQVGQASRYKKGIDVVIVLRSDGSCQIFVNDMTELEKLTSDERRRNKKPGIVHKYRFDLSAVVKGLRCAEARLSGRTMENGDWGVVGFIYDTLGQAIPWYLAQYRSMVANGTLGSPDVSGSIIRHDKRTEIVTTRLPQCTLLRQNGQQAWEPWGPSLKTMKSLADRQIKDGPKKNGRDHKNGQRRRQNQRPTPRRVSVHSTDGKEKLTHGIDVNGTETNAEK